ncbi:hypothetical protein L208DRAFT_1417453 [Tricholoma matsutake]|nr:hypothetical protein L208DRAFT_1417453 [Tricholoma matsutake 945]
MIVHLVTGLPHEGMRLSQQQATTEILQFFRGFLVTKSFRYSMNMRNDLVLHKFSISIIPT